MGKGNPRSALPAAGEAAPWHSLRGHNCGDNSIRAGELNSGKFQLLFPVLPRLDPAWNSPAGVQGAPRSSEPAPRPGCTSGPGAHRRSQPVYEQQPPAASRAPGALPDPGGKSRSSWGTLCHPFPAGQGHQLSPEPPQGMGTLPSTGGVTPCSALTPQRPPKVLWKSKFAFGEAGLSGMRRPRAGISSPGSPRGTLAPGDSTHLALGMEIAALQLGPGLAAPKITFQPPENPCGWSREPPARSGAPASTGRGLGGIEEKLRAPPGVF